MKVLQKYWSVYFFALWVAVALLAPIIANNDSNAFATLIPYSPDEIDYNNANYVGPFDEQDIESIYFKHWLGTDEFGRDVLARLIHGSKTALIIGLGAMLLAGIWGILIGASAAYWGDSGITIRRSTSITLVLTVSLIFILYFLIIPWEISTVSKAQQWSITCIGLGTILLVSIIINRLLSRFNFFQRPTLLPLDLIIGRIIEIFESIPLLFLLVALSAFYSFVEGSKSIVVIIAFVAWPSIAKYARSEVLKIKNLNYIENGKALGLSHFQIIYRHLLPNALSSVLVSLSFGLAAAILMESTLSFLGIGLETAQASWGETLASARQNYTAWWLAVFPGLLIFLTVLACHHLHRSLASKS